MLKVKQAINYKSSDGTMKNTGMLCEVGVVGINLLDYASSFKNMFEGSYIDVENLIISFGNKLDKPIDSNSALTYMFTNAYGFKKVKIETNTTFSNPMSLIRLFFLNNADAIPYDVLEEVDLTGIEHIVISNASSMFNGRKKLKRILGKLDFSGITVSSTEVFNQCNVLEEVRFKEGTIIVSLSLFQCLSLSKESIQSIIDGLADLTGQTAQTLTFSNVLKDKVTEEQISQITSKNWTLTWR